MNPPSQAPGPGERTGRLHGIQYLRALAALAVVCFHAAERGGGHFAIGAAGVDIFFVISGFIMWVVAESRPVSPARFFRDRLERIAPLYWIATGVMVSGGLLGLFPRMTLTPEHILGSFLFIPHVSPSNGQLWPVLVQGWTLNYEMFFYAVFAGALFAPPRHRLAALATIFAGLVSTGFLVEGGSPLFETYTNPILLEFLIGAIIGKAWLGGRFFSPAAGVALVSAAFAGFAFVGATYLGFHALVLGPLAAALVAGALALEKAGGAGRIPFLAYLGDSSYSIYLWHALAISIVAKFGVALSAPAALVIAAGAAAGVAAGIASYEILEKPIAAALKRRRRRASGLIETRPDPIR